jgi:hypothetical protein
MAAFTKPFTKRARLRSRAENSSARLAERDYSALVRPLTTKSMGPARGNTLPHLKTESRYTVVFLIGMSVRFFESQVSSQTGCGRLLASPMISGPIDALERWRLITLSVHCWPHAATSTQYTMAPRALRTHCPLCTLHTGLPVRQVVPPVVVAAPVLSLRK